MDSVEQGTPIPFIKEVGAKVFNSNSHLAETVEKINSNDLTKTQRLLNFAEAFGSLWMLWAIPYLLFKLLHKFNESAGIEHIVVVLIVAILLQSVFIVGTFGFEGHGFKEGQHYPYDGVVVFLKNIDVYFKPVENITSKLPAGKSSISEVENITNSTWTPPSIDNITTENHTINTTQPDSFLDKLKGFFSKSPISAF